MDRFLSLTNRLFEVICSNQNCISNWGFYLLSPEFDKEPELRNKIGTIWACSLLDTLEAQNRLLPELAEEARAQGWPTLAHAAQQLSNFCALVGEAMAQLTRDEQIFLNDMRNQLVHSYLSGRHRDEIKVKYYSNGNLCTERLSWDTYHKICRQFYEKGIDVSLGPMIQRLLDQKLRYWQAVSIFQKDASHLYQIMREGGTFIIKV